MHFFLTYILPPITTIVFIGCTVFSTVWVIESLIRMTIRDEMRIYDEERRRQEKKASSPKPDVKA